MKRILKLLGQVVVIGVLAAVGNTARAAEVYANDQNFVIRFNPGTNEVGDEIILAGTERLLTGFTFEYFGLGGSSGNEEARIRFYRNDVLVSGRLAPGTLFWDTGFFSIAPTDINRASLSWAQADLSSGNLLNLSGTIPTRFTWSVEFRGTKDGGEDYGVSIASPIVVGGNFTDYWERSGGTWLVRTNLPYSMDFVARFDAVPEPSTVVLGLLGVAGFLGLAWRRRLGR